MLHHAEAEGFVVPALGGLFCASQSPPEAGAMAEFPQMALPTAMQSFVNVRTSSWLTYALAV